MGTRISYIGDRLRNSYWFVPAVMLFGAAALAWVTTAIDERLEPEKLPVIGGLIFSGGPDAAHEVLGAIAASMITVAGVVFSIAIVTLQLASSQFGPRMLANFVRDRGHQITLGTFVSAFLYSLLVLRVVRTGDVEAVPHLSVTVALLLAIAGLSVLIYFVHHVATTIQAPNLVNSIAEELHDGIDRMFPDVGDVEGAGVPETEPDLPQGFETLSRRVDSHHTGYVQLIDLDRLLTVARDHDLVIRLDTRPGRWVVDNTPFAKAYPALSAPDSVLRDIAAAITTGARRTSQQDIEFPIKQVVEIGVRALSPGINDPFTASTCVDQLGAALCEIARRPLPSPYVLDDRGVLRIVNGDPLTWERIVGGAYDQIRQSASFHAPVYVHALESLTRIAGCVRDDSRLEPLLREAQLILEAAERNVEADADQQVIEQRYDDLVAAVEAVRTGV